jgi:hypothetical protein
MQDMEESNLESKGSEVDGDIESEVAKVEVGDFVVISNELEDGDPFVISHYTNVTPHLKTIGETNGMRAT